MTAQLLGAVASLHNESTLHTDIKPENIMAEPYSAAGSSGVLAGASLSSRGVVLIDFSNAMQLQEASAYHDEFEVTTLAYRAPELLYGQPFDAPIDIWSLGVTLAEMLSGRAMWHAASRGGLAIELAQLLGRPPAHLCHASAKYAAELAPLVSHMPDTLPHAEVRSRLATALDAPPTAAAAQLVDLIARMLAYAPADRPTALAALRHPFVAPVFPFSGVIAAAEASGASGMPEEANGGRAVKEVPSPASGGRVVGASSGGSAGAGSSGAGGSGSAGKVGGGKKVKESGNEGRGAPKRKAGDLAFVPFN